MVPRQSLGTRIVHGVAYEGVCKLDFSVPLKEHGLHLSDLVGPFLSSSRHEAYLMRAESKSFDSWRFSGTAHVDDEDSALFSIGFNPFRCATLAIASKYKYARFVHGNAECVTLVIFGHIVGTAARSKTVPGIQIGTLPISVTIPGAKLLLGHGALRLRIPKLEYHVYFTSRIAPR